MYHYVAFDVSLKILQLIYQLFEKAYLLEKYVEIFSSCTFYYDYICSLLKVQILIFNG